MISVTIIKYQKEFTTYFRENYFAGELVYYDKLVLERLLKDSFPIFKEEWQQEDDIDIHRSGYYDMKLALSMTERSSHDVDISQFFENFDSNIRNYKYLVIVFTGNPDRTYTGIIDINTLHSDESINEGQYYLYFSVTGIDKEFVDWMKQIELEPMLRDMDFESDYLPNWHFRFINPPNVDLVNLVSNLNINEKIFHSLTVDKATQNAFLEFNPGFSAWDGFKSFIIGYGFRFRLLYRTIEDNLPRYDFKLYFRSDAINTTTISKFLKIEKSFSYIDGSNVFMAYQFRPDEEDENIDHYQGFIMNQNNIFMSNQNEDIIHHKAAGFYRINNVTIYENTVKKINLPLYDANLVAGDVAYCRLVQGDDLQYVMQYVANTQLGYLLTALKSRRKITVKVPDDSNLMIGSMSEFDNKTFICERINSYDNFNQKMETEWIER